MIDWVCVCFMIDWVCVFDDRLVCVFPFDDRLVFVCFRLMMDLCMCVFCLMQCQQKDALGHHRRCDIVNCQRC